MARHSEPLHLFSAVEEHMGVMRRRLKNYPYEHAILNRLIAHIHKRIQDRYHAVLKPHRLNYTSYTALMMMYGTEDYTISPSDLASATGEKPTNVTRICDDLLAMELIDRRPGLEDRRRVEITLTKKGRKLVEQLQPELWRSLEQVYQTFSEPELKQFGAMLRKQLASVENEA